MTASEAAGLRAGRRCPIEPLPAPRPAAAAASLLAAFVLAFTSAAPSYCDAIVITKAMTATTIAEIFIEAKAIRVEIEIGGQDLPAFHNLMPDSISEQMGF